MSDITGFIRSCKSKKQLAEIINSKRFFFTINGLKSYKDKVSTIYSHYNQEERKEEN